MQINKQSKPKSVQVSPVSKTRGGSRFTWLLPKTDKNAALSIAASCNLSFPLASALVNRGITSTAGASQLIFSSFERDVHDASLFADGQKTVDRINKAIETKEKILIFGDYDVDGVSATSIVLLALKPLGANINFYIPNRVKDGYGISRKILTKAANAGFTLVITVDNGISAHDAAKAAKELKIDLIVTDHHQPPSKLPKAFALVNPNRKDCNYPTKELCGAGVIFKIMELLYKQRGLTLPDKVHELVALGTIADVVPLIGENRYWVRQGIAKMNKNPDYAVSCLAKNYGIAEGKIRSQAIGFNMTPQINAMGRIDDARDAVTFLVTNDHAKIQAIAIELKDINDARKKVESNIMRDVEMALLEDPEPIADRSIIFLARKNWPTGVIGLVAGKLMNRYGKPTFLLSLGKDGIAKGSCRSIPQFNVYEALTKNKKILTSFGGHTCAAGLALKIDDIPVLKANLHRQVQATCTPEDLSPRLRIDAYLDLPEADQQLMKDLERLEPYGNSNPVPLFIIENVTLLRPPELLKEKHVKCMIFSNGMIKPVIFFGRPDIYKTLTDKSDTPFDLACQVVKNEWNGTTKIELMGFDISIQN